MTNRDALCQESKTPGRHGGDQHTVQHRSARPAWSHKIGWGIVLLISLGTLQPAGAANTALHILDGIPPSCIPIVPSRKWDIWLNTPLLGTAGIQLPKRIVQKDKKAY